MRVKEIEAKSIAVASKLPDADFVINPYVGCQFGCLYCYASFMGRFVDEPTSAWGDYVYVKANAVQVLADQLSRWPSQRRSASIMLSSVTDPYHGIEARYRLTRGILELLAAEAYPGRISILTKSPLVLRDVDVLNELPSVEVGVTVTTTDDKLGRFLEVRAPLASRRLQTLKQLRSEGITTYAFVGPLLPHYRERPELLEELFAGLADANVGSVFVEHLNAKHYIRSRLFPVLDSEPDSVRSSYESAAMDEHKSALDLLVVNLVTKHGIKLRANRVLDHNAPKRDRRSQ